MTTHYRCDQFFSDGRRCPIEVFGPHNQSSTTIPLPDIAVCPIKLKEGQVLREGCHLVEMGGYSSELYKLQTRYDIMTSERDRWLKRMKLLETRLRIIREALEITE